MRITKHDADDRMNAAILAETERNKMGYKVVFEDWDDDDDEVFETEEEAEAYALVQISNYHTGADVLHMSNPGDNLPDDEDDDPEYEIVEVEN